MEVWSFSPLRVAAVCWVRPPPGGAAELRIVARLALNVGEGAIDIATTQALPDADELGFLDEGGPGADFTLPPNRRAARRIAGQHLDGGTLFAFRGAPDALAKLRIPALHPALFVGTFAAARACPWSLGGVALDVVDRVVSVHFRARVSVDPAERAFVALGADAPLTFADVSTRTRRFDVSFAEQRVAAERRVGDVAEIPVAPSAPLPPRGALEEETFSMGSAELDATLSPAIAPPSAPPPQRPPPLAIAEAPPKRSIGEILSLDPNRPRPSDSTPRAEAPVVPVGEVVLERVFVVDHAAALLQRTFPEQAKPLKRKDADAAQRRIVNRVASDAPRTRIADLESALAQAVREGILERHVVVASVDLRAELEPATATRALLAVAGQLVKGDDRFAKMLDRFAANLGAPRPRALARPDLELAALRREIVDTRGAEVATELEEAAFHRLFADHRAKLDVAGAPHVVLRASDPGTTFAAPVYVPVSAAPLLPPRIGFRARLLAELRPRWDELEASEVTLVAVALFRELVL